MALNRVDLTPSSGKYTFEYEESVFGGRLTWGDLNIPTQYLDEYVAKNPYPKEETFYDLETLYGDFVEGEGLATITVGTDKGKEWVENLVDYVWNNYSLWED